MSVLGSILNFAPNLSGSPDKTLLMTGRSYLSFSMVRNAFFRYMKICSDELRNSSLDNKKFCFRVFTLFEQPVGVNPRLPSRSIQSVKGVSRDGFLKYDLSVYGNYL